MYNFFVLGIVPGTNLQITFQTIIDLVELAIVIKGLLWLFRHRVQVREVITRSPSHASQLHQRLTF